jgi:ATP-dependent Clp protease ATP-binding subunit ClpA
MSMKHITKSILIAGILARVDVAPAAGLGRLAELFGGKSETIANESVAKVEAAAEAAVEDVAPTHNYKDIFYYTDKLQDKSSSLFSDIRDRFQSKHYIATIGRDTQVDALISQLNTPGVDVVALEGRIGVGKTQVVIGLQERVELDRVGKTQILDAVKNAWVVTVDSSNVAFDRGETVNAALNSLVEYVRAKDEKGLIVLAITDLKKFQGDGRALETFINQARDKIGPSRLKVVLEGEKEQIDKISGSGILRNIPRIEVPAFTTFELKKVATSFAKQIQNEPGVTTNYSIDEATIDEAVQLSQIYLDHIGGTKSIVSLLLGARTKRQQMILAAESNAAGSPVSAPLRSEISNLQEELARVRGLPGAHARQRVEKIPTEIEQKNAQIRDLDKHYYDLKGAIQRKNALLQDLERLKESGKGQEISEKADEVKKSVAEINKITIDEMAIWISEETKKPIGEILMKDLGVDGFRAILDKNLYGQPEFKELLIEVYESTKARIRTGEGPYDSYLAIGGPGTGKGTGFKWLGRALGKLNQYFGPDYAKPEDVSKLIGTNPGYQGFAPNETPELIKALEGPGLIGFDEIDRFGKAVLDFLYQGLDQDVGKSLAGNGQIGYWKQKVFGAATNLLSESLEAGAPEAKIKAALIDAGFPAAILNRINRFIVLNPANDELFRGAFEKQVQLLREKLANEYRGIKVNKEAEDFLLKPFLDKENRDPNLSARDINKMVTKNFQDQLNRILGAPKGWRDSNGLTHHLDFNEGDQLVVDHVEGSNELTFSIAPAP